MSVRERPILFSAPMVRAILDGRKTQTRRVLKPQPVFIHDHWRLVGHERGQEVLSTPFDPAKYAASERSSWFTGSGCPYGKRCDRLWVRETFYCAGASYSDGYVPHYRADAGLINEVSLTWKPSIFMPRWASRINLEITGVRVERLQEISEADARAEGITDGGCLNCGNSEADCGCLNPKPDARDAFSNLWQSINGAGSWASNPWVWVVEFKRA